MTKSILSALAVASLATAGRAAERTDDPARATAFITVVGTATLEVKSAWVETTETRDVELGSGSGFVFTSYGHVLTNYHVVSGDSVSERMGSRDIHVDLTVDRILVVFPQTFGEGSSPLRVEATVEAVDPELDLAVLAVNAPDIPYLGLGDSEASEPGTAVAVYGFPFGRQVEVGRADAPGVVPRVSVSKGAVSARRGDDSGRDAFLQTSATVNPGNSGGPMVDGEGFVLGVVRLKLRDGDGIGFAIPVNAVKDFLEFHGYGQLLPVERLRLGPEEALPGKGISLGLPDTMEDRSPARLVAFSDPHEGPVRLRAERVASPLDASELETLLLSGGTFGSFQATSEQRSRRDPASGLVVGSASGIDLVTGERAKRVYAIVERGAEKVLLRYDGSDEAVAFNESVLLGSVRSVAVEPLLTSEVVEPLAVEDVTWRARPLPRPGAPRIDAPESWIDEQSAPFPCIGLRPLDSALALSPPGDFTVSFRVGFWSEGPDPVAAAEACGSPSRWLPGASYAYVLEWLGVGYVVEGTFVEHENGLAQLEIVAPTSKHLLVRDLASAWLARNSRP